MYVLAAYFQVNHAFFHSQFNDLAVGLVSIPNLRLDAREIHGLVKHTR